jgi:hypothetical protein
LAVLQVRERTVAYVNADVCAAGKDLDVTASPALKAVVAEAARLIKDPDDERRSVS